MNKIILIGFRGSGKSTVGRHLAQKLGWEFRDADEEIEREQGRTIREIVKEQGWDYFRQLERLYLRGLLGKERLVCALGGGAVLHREEMEALQRESLIIWLKVPMKVIMERLKRDPKTESQRPPLTNLSWEKEIERLYAEREPLYRAFAHVTLYYSEAPVEKLVEKLWHMIKGRLGDEQYNCQRH